MSRKDASHTALESVHDSKSFLVFVKELIADRENEIKKEKISPSSPFGPGANGWENGTIETFLDAAAACTEEYCLFEREVSLQDNL